MKRFFLVFIGLFLMTGLVVANSQQVCVVGTPVCKDLIAAQHYDAGNVCAEVVDGNLVVTLYTTGGWKFVDAHLWWGLTLDDMPLTNKGNPKVGHFPYYSGDILGWTMYQFAIPLAEIGGMDYLNTLCGQRIKLAVHANVKKWIYCQGYIYETAWASGSEITEGRSWAMYFAIEFSCDCVNGD